MSEISRRAWLKALTLFSVAPIVLASIPAEAKVTKAAVHNRDHPKGMQMCHMCKYYIASGGRSAGMCMGHDGNRSLPTSPRQDQSDGVVRPLFRCVTAAPRSGHHLTIATTIPRTKARTRPSTTHAKTSHSHTRLA